MGLNGLRLRSAELVIVFVASRSRGRFVFVYFIFAIVWDTYLVGEICGISTTKFYIKIIYVKKRERSVFACLLSVYYLHSLFFFFNFRLSR